MEGDKDPIDRAEKGDVEYFKNVPKDIILGARSPQQYTVLDRAVMEASFECCEEICRRCPELVYHQNTADLTTAVTHAAYRGNTEKLKLLLDTAAMVVNGGGGGSNTPKKLLRMKDNVRTATPLHWAVNQKKYDAVKFLMDADPDGGLEYGPNEEGDTPLLLAMKSIDDPISVDIRKLILQKLPTQCLIRSGEKNWTVLHFAASKGHLDVIKDILRSCLGSAELKDNDNRNFLHVAVQFGRTEVVKHVVEHENIDPSLLNGLDNYGNTPFHEAALSGNQIMTEIFLYDPKVYKYTVNAKRQKVLDAVTFDYDKARAQVSGVRDRVDEKLLKDQSDFDLVVGALIAAVSFTAGITLPGGYISDGANKGNAVLSKDTAFETFVVSNTLGLVLSLYAVFSHFCARNLLDKKEIGLQVNVAMYCTLCAILAMVVAFTSGSYAVLNISHKLAMTVIAICCTFFLFTFWAVWQMVRQYKQKLYEYLSPKPSSVISFLSQKWLSITRPTTSGSLPTSTQPTS